MNTTAALRSSARTRLRVADRERLRDVVVGAELEPETAVQLVVAGGEHDDRNLARCPQALTHLQAVKLREHDVEDDEIHSFALELLQRLLAVPRGEPRGIRPVRVDR